MKRSVSFRSRLLTSDGTYVDVLCIYFGCISVDMGLATELVQDAIKAKEPIPDCIALLSCGPHAADLAETWQTNGPRAKVLMSRGRTESMRYLKELSIWQFADGSFQKLFTDPESTQAHDFDMKELVRSGLGHLVEEQKAYQVAPSGHVFKHPSGKRSKRFFLTSELVKDEVDAYFVALCICVVEWPKLLTTRRLYIDTMGIYPIARALEEICANGQAAAQRRWEIVSFHSHAGLATVHQALNDEHTILISASTSGSMAAALADNGMPARSIITILDVSADGRVGAVIHAQDRYLKERYVQVRSDDLANDQETAIELTGEYFAATGKKPRPLTLTIDHTPRGLKQLLSSFSKKGRCRLHSKRSGATSKIDAISLDEAAIVSDADFTKWIKAELRLKTPMSVSHVVAFDHEAAVSMARLCSEELAGYRSAPPTLVEYKNIGTLSGGDVTGVLVCAPLVGNGHAIRVVSRDLRELVPFASRHFLMGVGFPESEESWARLKQFLAQSGDPKRPYAVSEWQHVPLGLVNGGAGAWGRANSLMAKTEHIKPDPAIGWDPAVVQQSLELAGNALQDGQETFLNSNSGGAVKLTRGFVYWCADEREINDADPIAVSYLAMSAALQTAREFDVPAKRLKSSLHETVVLDPENFLRFNDSALQAALLRAAHPFELDYSATPELSLVMREFLEKVFLNHAKPYGEAALEFAFALSCKHLRLTSQDTLQLVNTLGAIAVAPSPLIGLLYLAWEAERS